LRVQGDEEDDKGDEDEGVEEGDVIEFSVEIEFYIIKPASIRVFNHTVVKMEEMDSNCFEFK